MRGLEAPALARRASGRDGEFFELTEPRVLPAAAVHAAYAPPSTTKVTSARDMEVFECGMAPLAAVEPPAHRALARRSSGRDLEY